MKRCAAVSIAIVLAVSPAWGWARSGKSSSVQDAEHGSGLVLTCTDRALAAMVVTPQLQRSALPHSSTLFYSVDGADELRSTWLGITGAGLHTFDGRLLKQIATGSRLKLRGEFIGTVEFEIAGAGAELARIMALCGPSY